MKLYYIYTFKLTFILLILISTTISCTFFNKSSTENEYSTDQYTFTNSVVIPLENRPILKISAPDIAIESISFDVNDKNSEVNYLEHVDVLSNIHYGRRGCLEIDVASPSGSILSVTKILNS